MSLDLLALLKGDKTTSRPSTARTAATPARPDEGVPLSPGYVTAAQGQRFVIKVPPPDPLFAAHPRPMISPFGSTNGPYYVEAALVTPEGAGVPPAPPLPPTVPPIYHIARTGGTTTVKTSTDVPLNERLYSALVRRQK